MSNDPTCKPGAIAEKRPGTSGAGGYTYKHSVLTLLLVEGKKRNKPFRLETKLPKAGVFSDAVFKQNYTTPDGQKASQILFFSIKFKENPFFKKVISCKKLFLKKYFEQYRIIREHFHSGKDDPTFSKSHFKNCQFIYFTNAKFDFSEKEMLKYITDSVSILYLGDNYANEYYQFEFVKKKDEIINFLNEELNKKALPEDVVHEEEIQDFIAKLKIYHSQPAESELGDIIKDKLSHSLLSTNDIDDTFIKTLSEVMEWWKTINTDDGEQAFLDEKFVILFPSGNTPFFFDIQSPVVGFVGREDYMKEIFKNCASNSTTTVVISNQLDYNRDECIGKSEMVKKYIEQHMSDYDALLWIKAATEATLTKSFYALAEKMRIKTINEDGSTKDLKAIVSDIFAGFQGKKCIFVYDGFENEKFFCEILLPVKHSMEIVHNLITSRHKEWNNVSKILLVEPLEDNEAIDFLKEEIKEDKVECLKHFVKENGRCPGDLKLAVDFIKYQREMGDFEINEYTKSDAVEWKDREKRLNNIF